MLMADTLNVVFIVLGFMLALPGLWLLCRGLWPDSVANTTSDCSRGLLMPFLVGIPISAFTFIAAVLASKSFAGAGGMVMLAIVCLYVFYASIGIAGLTTSIGLKLPSPADADRPWQATIRGSVVLELAYLLPILGWFLILPASLIIGSGSSLRSTIKNIKGRKKSDQNSGSSNLGAGSVGAI